MNTKRMEFFFRQIQASFFSFAILLPEVIIFSFMAGFHPLTALTTTLILSITTALFGSRPAMISGAAAAMAFLFADLNQTYGLSYVLATTIIVACLQIFFAAVKIHTIVHFIPKAVISGFLNALAFFIITAQFSFLLTSPITLLIFVLMIIGYLCFRKTSSQFPIALILIAIVFASNQLFDLHLPTLATTLEAPLGSLAILRHFPVSAEALQTIFPYALTIALVGICESLLTAKVVNKALHSSCNKRRETWILGLGNFFSALFGGFAGCGMIGTTITNLHHRGSSRLSSVLPSLFAFGLFWFSPNLIMNLPLIALATFAIILGYSLVDWQSLKRIYHIPPFETFVMIVTMMTIIRSHNLALGIVFGIILSALGFVYRAAKLEITHQTQDEQTTFFIHGALFFASENGLLKYFETTRLTSTVILDFSQARIFDESVILAIDTLIAKFERQNIHVIIQGESHACQRMLDRLAYHRHPNGLKSMPLH